VTIILLFMVIMGSYVCVRIGAVALELTGIPWERAKFQALSAFTNCGFTTSEAEDIVRHPLRRNIVSYLMILGNAGIVTTIGTFAGTIVGTNLRDALTRLGILAVVVALLAAIARLPFFGQRTRNAVQRWMSKRFDFAPTTEAMLRFDEGYCLTRFILPDDSPACGRALKDLRLRDHKLQILAFERGHEFHPVPGGDDKIEAGDVLIIYGTEDVVEAVFHPDGTERITVMVEGLHMSEAALQKHISELHERRSSPHDPARP
jgi:hypothetical protein